MVTDGTVLSYIGTHYLAPRPFPLASHVRFGSSILRSKYSCFDIEMCDAHDQTVVWVAELYCSGIRQNIFGLNDHDPYQAITVPARPLKVGNPLIADTPQLPPKDWPVSRLINYSIAMAIEFVFPHRYDDCFSIAAHSG
jgi:hypothetical protein